MATLKEPQNQEIFFDNGTRRSIQNIVQITRGTWWHLMTAEGKEYIINPDRVLFVRVTKLNG